MEAVLSCEAFSICFRSGHSSMQTTWWQVGELETCHLDLLSFRCRGNLRPDALHDGPYVVTALGRNVGGADDIVCAGAGRGAGGVGCPQHGDALGQIFWSHLWLQVQCVLRHPVCSERGTELLYKHFYTCRLWWDVLIHPAV